MILKQTRDDIQSTMFENGIASAQCDVCASVQQDGDASFQLRSKDLQKIYCTKGIILTIMLLQ